MMVLVLGRKLKSRALSRLDDSAGEGTELAAHLSVSLLTVPRTSSPDKVEHSTFGKVWGHKALRYQDSF